MDQLNIFADAGSESGFGSGSSLPLLLPAGGFRGPSGGAYSRGDIRVFGSSGTP
jgi:hypothetical protein